MESRPEHEFDFDEEEVIIGLSESLYRYALMSGVVGLALMALGIEVWIRSAYGGGLAGPGVTALGVIVLVGGFLFAAPRATFDQIASTKGSDISRLMEGMDSLISALGTLRLVLVALLLARLVGFLLTRAG